MGKKELEFRPKEIHMSIIIQVTAEDISKGRPSKVRFCPIALAATRQFPGRYIGVGYRALHIGNTVYRLPPSAVRFIQDFDLCVMTQPFSFVATAIN